LISRPIAYSSSSSGQQHQLPQQQATLKRTTRGVGSHVKSGEKEGGDGGEGGEGGEGGGTAKRQRAAEGRPNPIRYADLKAVDLIGKGVCSSVFHAVWNGTDVAVKRVLRSVLQREAVKGFEAESRILFQLRHPNVIQLYGTCEHQGQLLLVTELLGRGSLRDVLDDEAVQLPWAQKLSFARDAAAGLYYLHSFDGDRAIMHRDVKSANFLVGNDWTVKVGDFGISRILSSETELRKTLCGTMSYCAPEILLGKPYTVSVDVYSFGIVMWEILTRDVPFTGMTAAALREAVTKGKRPPISQAMLERYPEYCRLLVSCVVPNPDARPAMKTALNDLVEQKLQCPK
ncbi:MAG: protein kinase, partial [archaeon]|nr:protein kinase [archaeon]